MNIELNPGISTLDHDSLCYSIYTQLYHNFFNAQDGGTINEGDSTSIRLHNTAYGFADAISGSVAGGNEGGENGGILLNYLKKSGGDMTGLFRANYGFEAGIDNNRVLYVYRSSEETGLEIIGNLRIGGDNLYFGTKRVIRYEEIADKITIAGTSVDFGDATLSCRGKIIIGADEKQGISLSPAGLFIKGYQVYHAGSANLPTIDWAMRDALVERDLLVNGKVLINEELSALNGVKLGFNNKMLLTINDNGVILNEHLNISPGYGVKIGGTPVLMRIGETDIELSCEYGNLHLGSEQTYKIKLFAGITDIDGDNILLSKYGNAYFPGSLRIAHNYGADLLSSYRINEGEEGIIIHKKLRFGSSEGLFLSGTKESLTLKSDTDQAEIGFRTSTSLLQLPGVNSKSLYITPNCDFITLDKPLETKGYIGIDNSFTRLTEKHLFLSNDHYLMSGTDGIIFFGNTYFINNLSSESFASGFAGYGWGILRNRTTGNIVATFDELNIRKKMRIYELEVQRNSVTNGSLWISDSCSGDQVEKIT